MASLLIVGGSVESRLLIRGLLKLHRHQVLGEAETVQALGPIPATPEKLVIVVDADLEEGSWESEIRALLAQRPGLSGVLLMSDRSQRAEAKAKSVGLSHVIRRPFAVRELMEAVSVGDPPPPVPSALGPS